MLRFNERIETNKKEFTMLVTVDGIVIGSRNAGDSGRYLDILTKEYGVIEVAAHGIKKLNSKNAGSTSMFSYSTFCMNKSGLKYTINSTSPKFNFYGISQDIIKLSLAAYFAEIIKYTSASEQYESDTLRFLAVTLYELERERQRIELIKAIFELRICTLLGFTPDLRACSECVCYEREEMYFVLEDSNIICGECFSDNSDYTERFKKSCFLINPHLLYVMRYILYSETDKLYKVKAENNILKELGVITEKNLLYQLGRRFKTLDYYKKL